jgi:cell division protein FtsB
MSRPSASNRATLRRFPAGRRRPGADSALESAASEFALLAQRRARLARQIDLLDRQRAAAATSQAQLAARMAVLRARIDGLAGAAPEAASLPSSAPPQPPPPPAPSPVPPARRRALTF